MNQVLPYLWYPMLLVHALAVFAALCSAGLAPPLAAYVPVIATGVMVFALEYARPARRSWRPRWRDLATDTGYLAAVQILVPRGLAGLLAVTLAAGGGGAGGAAWWPHHWPLPAQVFGMMLIVDAARYGLHRACHAWPALWRLHAVHHAPERLYSLNVGRFHPFEKGLHFLCDTLPFVILGVAPAVIAGYFVIYAVNGFLQHCNVRLRFGWLDDVIATASAHRWHHACDPLLAPCNFGSTLIIWDRLFGTHYRALRQPRRVGIATQARTGGANADTGACVSKRLATCRERLLDLLIGFGLRVILLKGGIGLAVRTRQPRRHQRRLLQRILKENRSTAFGRTWNFGALNGYEDYARTVPVCSYDDLRPYIDTEMHSGAPMLTARRPQSFVTTSGTTGAAKYVPITPQHYATMQATQRLSVAWQHRVCPAAFKGAILTITGTAHEGRLADGRSFGAASGMLASNTPRLLRGRFVVPAAISAISDAQLKYLVILRLALARDDVTYCATANPSTLLALLETYREHYPALLRNLRAGGFFLAGRLDRDAACALDGRLGAVPARAAELERLGPRATLAELWPRLALLAVWTFGSAGTALQRLRRELAADTCVFELGYVSSEFRGTLTLGRRAGTGLPTLETHFFEFVEKALWDAGRPCYLTLDQVRKGREYYVIVTTPSGLYRYFINDLVRVTGFLNKTPLLAFIQKGRGVTNLTGEKLYEAQLLGALKEVGVAIGCDILFVMALADEARCGYRLYLECEGAPRADTATLAGLIDEQLCAQNVEYAAKRRSRRLAALELRLLSKGCYTAYKRHGVEHGQRESQFKTVAINYASTFPFDLDGWVRS